MSSIEKQQGTFSAFLKKINDFKLQSINESPEIMHINRNIDNKMKIWYQNEVKSIDYSS